MVVVYEYKIGRIGRNLFFERKMPVPFDGLVEIGDYLLGIEQARWTCGRLREQQPTEEKCDGRDCVQKTAIES